METEKNGVIIDDGKSKEIKRANELTKGIFEVGRGSTKSGYPVYYFFRYVDWKSDKPEGVYMVYQSSKLGDQVNAKESEFLQYRIYIDFSKRLVQNGQFKGKEYIVIKNIVEIKDRADQVNFENAKKIDDY